MTHDNRTHEFDAPDLSLNSAVLAVLAESLPEDAIERVKSRAKLLADSSVMPPQDKRRDTHRQVLSYHRFGTWSALAAAVAAVLLVIFGFSRNTSVAWAEMLETIRACPWVHGTTTYSQGQQSKTSEFWISNTQRVAAFQFGELAQFEDFEKDITLKYNVKENTIDRLPSLQIQRGNPGEIQTSIFLDRLLDKSQATQDMFYGERVIKAQREEVEEGGEKWIEYVVHLQKIDNLLNRRTVRIRLNAGTQLPVLCEERDANGMTSMTRFDYPDTGPNDIYDLGVPKTAKVIDRIPRGELARIDRTVQVDRRHFDDYDAVVVEQTDGVKTSFDSQLENLRIKRVRRSGNRYRVDQLLVPKAALTAPTEDTDLHAWWSQNRAQFWSVPQLICDGQHTFLYQMLDDRILPDKKPNLSLVLTTERQIDLPVDDPTVEWPFLMPEQCSRPHLWISDGNRTFDVVPDAKDGPTDSVRVVVSGKKGSWTGDLYRYWFDSEKDYILLKSVATVFKKNSDEVDSLETNVYDDFAQSPGGRWFPQQARRTSTDPESANRTQVTRFYVDFAVDLPAELFQPVRD